MALKTKLHNKFSLFSPRRLNTDFNNFVPILKLYDEAFCENQYRLKAVHYFRKKALSYMFDRVFSLTTMNAYLPDEFFSIHDSINRCVKILRIFFL